MLLESFCALQEDDGSLTAPRGHEQFYGARIEPQISLAMGPRPETCHESSMIKLGPPRKGEKTSHNRTTEHFRLRLVATRPP